MYKTIQDNIVLNDIWVMPYGVLCNNPSFDFREKCNKIFPNVLTDNSMIIYNSSEDDVNIIGYYNLEELHITKSPRFEAVRNLTRSFHVNDNVEFLKKQKCAHISSWIFDHSLHRKDYLYKICENIITKASVQYYLVWREDNNGGLLFFPTEQYNNAITFFTDAFMKNQVL